ncbi:MAG: hypothetical protein Q4C85_08720 [Actinomyces sp.]|uniref:hypothetical protein n=1 Tax=Actinomyces sp. TaxID=29317 RepID=UPI0026DC7011|nr:hypothetical protein [Actinomyces sp.]MDO4243821.1 hypothetical protein [Actinomyces sp.]
MNPASKGDIAAALRRCEDARAALDAAAAEHREAMIDALDAGAPKYRVADAAGVTPQTVYGLLGWKRTRS